MFFSSYALPSFLFDSPLLPTSRNNPTSKLNSRSRYTLSSLSPSFSSIFVVYVPVIVTRTRRVARNQDIDRKTKDRLDSHQAGLSVPFFPSLPFLLSSNRFAPSRVTCVPFCKSLELEGFVYMLSLSLFSLLFSLLVEPLLPLALSEGTKETQLSCLFLPLLMCVFVFCIL